MSFVFTRLQAALRNGVINKVPSRCFTRGVVLHSEEAENDDQEKPVQSGRKIDPEFDRRKPIPVETSIRYLASEAYKISYGEDPIWKPYRRNFKGQRPPQKTRKTCIRQGIIATGNPCPICRDKYLVLDHRNTALLKQFVSPINGEVISYVKTGLCQRQHQNLLIALHRARDYGTLNLDVPRRVYDYSEWYKPESEQPSSSSTTTTTTTQN